MDVLQGPTYAFKTRIAEPDWLIMIYIHISICDINILTRKFSFRTSVCYRNFIHLTHSFPIHPYGFLMFSVGRERVHWEQMV